MSNYIHDVKLATHRLESKEISMQDWIAALLGEEYRDMYSDEYCRRCAKVFSVFVNKLEEQQIDSIDNKDTVAELLQIKEDIKAERVKLQTKTIEYNAIERLDARNDLFQEQILQAIRRLEPIQVRELSYTPPTGQVGLLVVSDIHAGDTFKISGLYGETVNEYSYDIACSRLERLMARVCNDDNIIVDKLVVANLGDIVGGKLRAASLLKLREPVCDTVIRFSEWYAHWLISIRDCLGIPIEVVTTSGNHDITRDLTNKVIDENENVAKYFVEFLKLRLSNVDGITIDDCTDVAVKNINGFNCMFTHGQDKDLSTTLQYFSNLYNTSIDYVFGGHLHNPNTESIGVMDVGDVETVRVGSVMGIDAFAKKLRKSASPSAHFSIFTDEGRTWSRNFYL